MKKILISLILLISCIKLSAQTYWYQATKFAFANITNGFYSWNNWEDSNVKIEADLDNSKITIYSPTIQIYKLISIDESNSEDTTNIKIIDQDGDRGHIRLKNRNGEQYIYIDFQNVSWVYKVHQISK